MELKFLFQCSLQSGKFFILRKIQRHIIINAHTSSCKVPVILVTIYSNFNFLNTFPEKSSNITFQ